MPRLCTRTESTRIAEPLELFLQPVWDLASFGILDGGRVADEGDANLGLERVELCDRRPNSHQAVQWSLRRFELFGSKRTEECDREASAEAQNHENAIRQAPRARDTEDRRLHGPRILPRRYAMRT